MSSTRSARRWLGWLALPCAAVVAAAAFAAPPGPATFDLDPQHSFVHFEVVHFGTSTIRGRFGPLAGAVELDRVARHGRVAVRIATAGVDTGVRVFDARLREPDLLAAEAFPEAFFVAERFRFDERTGALAEVRGEFTLRGVSRPLSLHARLFGCRTETPSGREVCGGEFEAQIDRSEFGATFGLPLIANRVRLRIQVEGRRRAD